MSTAASPTLQRLTPRESALAILLSIVVLIPCFWQQRIQAGDLGSHVYNAWLAQLIAEGKAPGLYIVKQYNNIFFDLTLLNLSRIVGFVWAERIAVSFCVLVFFWGVFSFASAEARRRPWFLTPGLAMLAYGYVFQMGFMNFYLSIGLACFGLAALWRGTRKGIVAAVILAPITLLAHPLGFLLLICVGAYRLLGRKLGVWIEIAMPALAVVVALVVFQYVRTHAALNADWGDEPFYQHNGFDQFWVVRPSTQYVVTALLIFAAIASFLDLRDWRKDKINWKERRLPLELYAVAFLFTALLPENLRPDPDGGWIGLLVTRLTITSAIFGFCWLATLKPRVWHAVTLVPIAVVYFTFLYQDSAWADRLEQNARKITAQLPFGTRVAATLYEPRGYRMGSLHVVDRACVGYCFLYSNYEPSTRQFRIRVHEGSPVAASSVDDSEDLQSGNYDVQDEDLPLKEIYQCKPSDLTVLCIRDLSAGEKNGRYAYGPYGPEPPPTTPLNNQ
jgi:hypothetical protein